MITKELLSEVLNIKGNFRHGFDDISILELDKVEFNSQTNRVFMSLKPSMLYGTVAPVIRTNSINVYELAHKCKEWATEFGYYISSGYSDMEYDGDSCEPNYKIYATINLRCGYHSYNSKYDRDDWSEDISFDMNTSEPEAVFKACQWILDNKDKKDG
jgi:hypothetical protein